MTKEAIPYLCGGTFLCQVLRARKVLKSCTDHTKSQKESLSERNTFERLISIFQLRDFIGGPSLKTYTSKYKKCTDSLLSFTQFSDSDLRVDFDKAVTAGDPKIIKRMVDFVAEFIDVDGKGKQLVRSLLGTIKDDRSILDGDEFYVERGKAVTKGELVGRECFTIEYFLLGVWHFIIMKRADKNEKGEDTYNFWYPRQGNYCGKVGSDIVQNISVDSIPVLSAITDTKDDVLILPSQASGSKRNVYSESEKELLREFTADYDDLVMKCIGANFAEYLICEPVGNRITELNKKWSTKADKFENLSLKSSVWALLNYLNELRKVLDDEGGDSFGPSLRRIQMKLRNLYVKLHPDNYADSFLYDAVYDDWNLGEDY